MKVALITGITGQDGSYLAELLLDKGYFVYGIIRRSSLINTQRINHIYDNINLKLFYGDLSDTPCFTNILSIIKNKFSELEVLEIYNLGAMSHVKVSFEVPEYTANIDGIGTLRILEAIKTSGYMNKIRFYQASTSELYGKVVEVPQTELTPFYPRSPYACSKLFAYWITINYREAYGIHASNGILFNHESPRRGETFVTRKITRCINDILIGRTSVLKLGNLNAKRDWGHAKDFVKGMWLMLQKDSPDDYVLATGKQYSVRDFVKTAFELVNIKIDFKGNGLNEKGIELSTGRVYVEVDEKYFRPAEVDTLLGCPLKAETNLNWTAETSFSSLVREMVWEDTKEYRDAFVKNNI